MPKPILLIDNFDSFTYNLVHYIEAFDFEVELFRNNKLNQIDINKYGKVIISPGPGLPSESGELIPFLKQHYKTKSILGICLGQQAIAELFGGNLLPLPEVKHGVSETITHLNNDYIYKDIPNQFNVGLYFSWHVTNLPKQVIVTSSSNDNIVMSLKHQNYNIRALQYHPESIMTTYGKQILQNWLIH